MSREIPIIFNGDMVRAILAGQKTQTRRPINPAPMMITDSSAVPWEGDPETLAKLLKKSGKACPFGQPGDLLWVRETWSQIDDTEFGGERWIDYRATPKYPESSGRRPAGWDDEPENTPLRWRQSIHMPRWASRILLRVTAVRVERVQDLSEQDAMAEGVTEMMFHPGRCLSQCASGISFPSAISAYRDLWESIYGNWDVNPWVWVVEFERATDSKQEAA